MGVLEMLEARGALSMVCLVGLGLTACSLGERERVDAGGAADDGTSTEWPELGSGSMMGSGSSTDRWHKADVSRDGVNYLLMANGWGPNFQSQSISWNGTSFVVDSMLGSAGNNYEPASYPTMFCGVYSDDQSGECGLPRALDSIGRLYTGWSWRPNGNTGQYNAAYDIWLGSGTTINTFTGFLMVWYRDPPGQQPAGQRVVIGANVENTPGRWNIWEGNVNGRPYLAYSRAEGEDTLELEFDVMDFVRDAQDRNMSLPGSHVLSVAIGFEVWNGPVSNIETTDFFVSVE